MRRAPVEGYRVTSVYVDAQEKPMGARYVHPNGLKVDILRFASVPQVSVSFGSLPSTDKGEAHAQEHLLLGKGTKGKFLNGLISMSLGDFTAGTHADRTHYQFYTAGNAKTFFGLLRHFFSALIRPDYSDDEILWEAAHIGVDRDPGTKRWRLSEKGTVYAEMSSTMERSQSVNWHQLTPLLFGRDNSLARNHGGLPSEIRRIVPGDIRRFHAKNYHFGSNLSIVAALPPEYPPGGFLAGLNAVMAELEPEAAAALPGQRPDGSKYDELKAFEPAAGAPILIGAFPSENDDLPQGVTFAWKPLGQYLGARDQLELTLLLSVLADGDTSLLYGDLVDEKTRKIASGAANIGSYFDAEPANVPMIFLTGMSPSKLTEKHLGAVREVLLDRIRSMSRAGKQSPYLARVNAKAMSLLSSWRKTMLKFVDSPPRFGFRGTGIGWHRHLDALAQTKGLRKELVEASVFSGVEEKIASGKNFWAGVIEAQGLDQPMLVGAVVPEKGLLAADRKASATRLKKAAETLKRRWGVRDEQKAFKLEAEATALKKMQIKRRDASIKNPPFVDAPPLSLDESIDTVQETLRGGVPATVSRFPSTPFTDIGLYFNLRGVPVEDRAYLPVLSTLFTDLGVSLRDGTKLDYVGMEEAWRSQIYRLGSGYSADPRGGRLELSLSASASSPAEIGRTADWLENALLRPDISSGTIDRLRSLLHEEIESYRALFQGEEEEWAVSAANAYVYQNDPYWMALSSPFTRLQLLSRVYFRLGGYPDARTKAKALDIFDILAKEAKTGSRDRMRGRLRDFAGGSGVEAEIVRYFDAEFPRLPEETWRRDMGRLISETKADLTREPGKEMRRLRRILKGVLTRGNLRVAVTGNHKNARAAVERLGTLLRRLPLGHRVKRRRKRSPVVFQRLQERFPGLISLPVHAGLLNNDTKSGVFVLSAPCPSYRDTDADSLLDYLAGMSFGGSAPHSFFMKTWSAGLAYSNGISASASSGRIMYYAERSPDLAATMRFVAGLPARLPRRASFLVDYGLANAFVDYRGASTFSSRGAAMAADIADGRGPAQVRRFKKALLGAAKSPGASDALRDRLPGILGSVLVGYGVKMKDIPGTSGFVIGPEGLLAEYEKMLVREGEAERLVRLYPRDFWLTE